MLLLVVVSPNNNVYLHKIYYVDIKLNNCRIDSETVNMAQSSWSHNPAVNEVSFPFAPIKVRKFLFI